MNSIAMYWIIVSILALAASDITDSEVAMRWGILWFVLAVFFKFFI
jgi:hypothetical protein